MQRNISIDVLKLILSFFVIGLHISLLEDFDANLGFILNQGIFRIAVPVFLVINGYYFSNINDWEKYKKWIKRVFFLYLFWMFFYLPFWVSKDITKNFIYVFNGYFHLWYIIGLIYASFLLFLLRRINPHIHIILSFKLYSIGTLLQYLHSFGGFTIETFVYRNFLFFCLPFLMIGFLIKKFENEKKLNNVFYVFILLFFSELSIDLYLSGGKAIFDLLFTLLLICPVIFILVKKKILLRNNKNIGLVSSAIYFIHPSVLFILRKFYGLYSINEFLVVLLGSIFLTIPLLYLNKKLRIL